MRGRSSVWRRAGALEARMPRRVPRRSGWDFDALSVEELEALMPLSEKQAAAEATGVAPAWTPEELVLLHTLATKAGTDRCG